MEIRANYVLVGAFALLSLLGGFGLALWMGSSDNRIPMAEYDISITDSVKGLSVNNDVLFSGIRVGKVTDIKISHTNPGEVRVRVSIAADTPVREDSLARLELWGITGVSVVAISGGTVNSPLKPVPLDEAGEIGYEPSPLSSVVARMPDVLNASNRLLQRMETVFSDENAREISNILSSLSKVSGVLADRAETLDAIFTGTETLLKDIDTLTVNTNEALVTHVKATGDSMTRIAKRVDGTLAMMEPGLKQFSTQGLAELRLLMAELRNMAHVLARVGQKLENDPGRFLFGDPVKEYKNR